MRNKFRENSCTLEDYGGTGMTIGGITLFNVRFPAMISSGGWTGETRL